MTVVNTEPWQERDLNAMLTGALRRYGNREAMYDGDESVTYATLFRRAVALSCFIDEAVLGAEGSVVLYLPSGLVALRSLLAVSLSGRTAVPLDALAGARRVPGAKSTTRFEEHELPDLSSLSSTVGLVLTVTPLARYIDHMKSECRINASCPVLYADEAANQMDETHQSKIRERLAQAMTSKPDGTGAGGDKAAIEFGRMRNKKSSGDDARAGGLRLTQTQLMSAVARAAEAERKEGTLLAEEGALVMTSTEEPTTWTHGYLSALARGVRLNFIRFFYPAHVAQAIREDHARCLLLNSAQYEALSDELKQNGTAPDLRCLTNEEPSAELAAKWAEAADDKIETVSIEL